MRRLLLLTLSLALTSWAQNLTTTPIISGLTNPTDIQHAGDGSGRIFIAEQSGLIRILKNGALNAQPFLDIRARVNATSNERGLLGLAFAPNYAQSGRFYVNYINAAGNTVIAQFGVTANADIADPTSEIPLLTINQPFTNHNGGQLQFGPDGYLYIALGDGGSGGDPQNHGQRLDSLLGKILRVDVESQPGQLRIPPSNPFVNQSGARGEIWAYGLRNPWRFSFDRDTGHLYIADVGQDQYEEVNFQPAASTGGENYGWRIREGTHCYNAQVCAEIGIPPVTEYNHSNNACSVTGGFVYRGNVSLSLRGLYIYGDFCNGRIFALEQQGGTWTSRPLLTSGFQLRTFGEDQAGELYVASGSTLYRLDASRAPRILSAAAVTNAASFESGLVAGSLATVFAAGVFDSPGSLVATDLPLQTTVEGVSITIDGFDAPIYSIANSNGLELLNFQVPWEVAGRSQVAVAVTRNGQASTPVTVQLLAQQPGIFATESNLAIAVHNANYTLVTQQAPLESGEFAFVYALGIGPVTNTPATGQGSPGNPLAFAQANVEVTLGGIPCEVQFAGLAPTLVGVYQINFRVPPGVPSGLAELALRVNGTSTTRLVYVE